MANNLKRVRLEAGMKVQELIERARLPLSQPHISLIECSRMMPTAPVAMSICEALGKDPATVFGADLGGLERLQRVWEHAYSQAPPSTPKWQGNPELRVRMEPQLRRQFLDDIACLGWADFSAWMHAMARATHRERLSIKHGSATA